MNRMPGHLRALKAWADLSIGLATSHREPVVDWTALGRMIALADVCFRFEHERLQELLRLSDDLLKPLHDPLHVSFGAHRWLAADREEAYSDWLQWLVQQLVIPERVFGIFGTPAHVSLNGHTDGPKVEREVWVPQGHAGHTGRLDLVIAYGTHALLVVEVKTTGADAADTLKQEGYRAWLNKQEVEYKPDPILLATDATSSEYHGGFRFVSWAEVCLRLRRISVELHCEGQGLLAAMTLAFVGAVEQNLLGLAAPMGGTSPAGHSSAFDTKVVDHLEAWLSSHGEVSNGRP